MSTDISDNQQPDEFLHNIISDRVRDLSNNPRLQFLNYWWGLLFVRARSNKKLP